MFTKQMSIYRSEKSLVDSFVRHLRTRESHWGTVQVRREFDYQRGRTDVLAVSEDGNVIAFEAKLLKWREALHQAYRNTCFANKSYVLLPLKAAFAAHQFQGEFARRNVGLCYLDKGKAVVLREATKVLPLQPWLQEEAVRSSRVANDRKSTKGCCGSLRGTRDAVNP